MGIRTKLNPMGGENKKIFTRPNLNSDGTMGGDYFAVIASSVYSNAYLAYRAVDSDTSTNTYWRPKSSASSCYYAFYNPKALKVTKLILTFTSSTQTRYFSRILASILSYDYIPDFSTEISTTQSTSSNVLTLTLDNNNFYRYYTLYFSSYSVRLCDLQIEAEEQ